MTAYPKLTQVYTDKYYRFLLYHRELFSIYICSVGIYFYKKNKIMKIDQLILFFSNFIFQFIQKEKK